MDNKTEFNSFSLINYIWKWRKLFLIICCAAAVLSFFFSTNIFIRPEFKATTVIYAPRTNSVSRILMSDNNPNERMDIKAYAIEEETEQMMQILNSREIKDVLIERYDLVSYYNIEPYVKGWKTKLYETIDGNIDIKRTKYGAIAITVIDWNPDRAAQMANDIASELDTIKNKIEFARTMAACQVMEEQVQKIEFQRQLLTDSLEKLAKKGVFTFESQSERVIQQLAIALAQGNTAGVQRLQKEIEKLEKWGTIASQLRRELMYLSDQMANVKVKLLNTQMDMKGAMPVKFVIENAIAPDKKFYPKKLIISVMSTISAFIITLMTLLFVDKIRKELIVEPTDPNKQE
jgi:capsular polysaccharide biosynthesis protein